MNLFGMVIGDLKVGGTTGDLQRLNPSSLIDFRGGGFF
jgi:hypothetical protein